MKRCIAGLVLALLAPASAAAAPAAPDQGRVVEELGGILSERQRVETVNRMLRDRLDNLLPGLMLETGIDMWLVINREYAEDPVYLTLVPEPVFAARRTTMLVFHDRGPDKGVERLIVSRYSIPGFYEPAWEGGALDEQWRRLRQLIAERDPERIGINTSREWAEADGLTASLKERLAEALGPPLARRLVSAERLTVRWLEIHHLALPA